MARKTQDEVVKSEPIFYSDIVSKFMDDFEINS